MHFELLSVEILCNLCSVERVTCLFIVFHFHCGFSYVSELTLLL